MSDSLQASYMSSCDTLSCMKLVHADTFDRGSNKPSENAFDKYWPANSIQDWTPIHACEALDFQKKSNRYRKVPAQGFKQFWILLMTDSSLGSLAWALLVWAMRDLRSLGLSKLQCAALLCMGAPPVLWLGLQMKFMTRSSWSMFSKEISHIVFKQVSFVPLGS